MRAIFTGVVVAGLWTAANGVRYVLDPAARYRAESAWFLFAAVLLLSVVVTRNGRRTSGVSSQSVWSRKEKPLGVILLMAAALALYSPVLSIGLLSDDFVLLKRAQSGALLDPGWEYLRPFPLAIWQLADQIMPRSLLPLAMHVLNAVLHGVNAWLVALAASRLGLSRAGSAFAGLLFLSSPLAVEPVAWPSGIFDLVVTGCVLTAVLVMLADRLSAPVRIGLISLCTLIAIASKETAVAMPVLLALLVPVAGTGGRKVVAGAVLTSLAIVGVYVVWRLSAGIASAQIVPASGYALKEVLSRPFGALGLPLHSGVMAAVPAVAIVLAVLWPAAFVRAARSWQHDRLAAVVVAAAALWVLVSIVPLSAMFFVGPDLQGSRYLYLASAAWSVAIVVLMAGFAARPAAWSRAAVAVLIAGSAAAVIIHQRPWIQAGLERDKVLAAFRDIASQCPVATASNLPDHVAGAYVFRNGFAEATSTQPTDRIGETDHCVVRWSGTRFVVER